MFVYINDEKLYGQKKRIGVQYSLNTHLILNL